ncbi:MAG: ATP-dependent helicase [Candidatus Omnitrophota bacterium]
MKKKIDYDKELNSAQLAAARSTEGPHLVIAGAGSGKTRTLVYRVAYLVEKGIKPEEILLLTFTRKAAEEMLRRASELLDERCRKVSGGTFHSFANMVLRRYAAVLEISPNFTIMDQSDAEDAVNLVRARLGFNNIDKSKSFPRKSAILDVISKSVNKPEDIGAILRYEYPHFTQWEDEIMRIRLEYAGYKRSKSLMDYDDLLVFLKKLLENNQEARLKLSAGYKYIMVDEYQDTNKLQADIARLLASVHNNIMVVGDDSQSIYSFRGADFRNIIDFPKIFKGTRIITLEENYRSTQPILDLTNEVISFAQEKFDKVLFTSRRRGAAPVLAEVFDEHAQSRYIVDKISQLMREGVGLKDIAVLFRAGWHSNDLEIALANRGLPFIKYGGQRFVEAAHIKDVISHLRIAHNISDQISWNRALLLMRGVGPKTAERVTKEVITEKKGLKPDKNLFKKVPDLQGLMEILEEFELNKPSPSGMVRALLKYYEPLLKAKYDDFNKRLNDLDSLEKIASRYSSVEEFLSDMALEPPEKNFADNAERDNRSLTLSTIHSSKGLEWHTVFVIYVAEGHLPSYRSIDDKDRIEEERRLFYVAITRAKENLFLLKPGITRSARWAKVSAGDGGSVFTRTEKDCLVGFTEVSRFLREGDIMSRFLDCEKTMKDGFEDIEFEDIFGV